MKRYFETSIPSQTSTESALGPTAPSTPTPSSFSSSSSYSTSSITTTTTTATSSFSSQRKGLSLTQHSSHVKKKRSQEEMPSEAKPPAMIDSSSVLTSELLMHMPLRKKSKILSNEGRRSSQPETQLAFHELYSCLSFRFVQLNDSKLSPSSPDRKEPPVDDLPPFVLKNAKLLHLYKLLACFLRDPVPLLLNLSSFTESPCIPLSHANLESLLLLKPHRQTFDLHVCAPDYEAIADEITQVQCHDKFHVFVYVSRDHLGLTRWQERFPHVTVRTVGKLPHRPPGYCKVDDARLDFWDQHVILDRQVLYHETEDLCMQRKVSETAKFNLELMDYAIAWNIFGEESKPTSIIIFNNFSCGIRNLAPVLLSRGTWAIHPNSTDEFRIMKAWILAYCF